MMICKGHIYGVILNDRDEVARLAPAFQEKPYLAPPAAPVVFMKPTVAVSRGTVRLEPGRSAVAAATVALLIARDTTGVSAQAAMDCIGAAAIAIDISYAQADYYRPAVAQRNADGFLVMGDWRAPAVPERIITFVNGRMTHEWPLDRLIRATGQLIADISAFLTLRAGDVLLVGLPGDAPMVEAGMALRAEAAGFDHAAALIQEYVQ